MHTLLAASDTHVLAAGMILSGVKGIFYLIGGIIAAVVCALIAKSKGHSAVLFGILGFFFSIIIPHRDPGGPPQRSIRPDVTRCSPPAVSNAASVQQPALSSLLN